MSDLEKMWEDLPSGTAPVDDILREGRRSASAQRRKFVTRPLIAATALTGIAAAFLVGTAVGPLGGGKSGDLGTSVVGPNGGPSPVAFQADLKPAASCDVLLSVYQNRALGLVSAYGWGGQMTAFTGDAVPYAANGLMPHGSSSAYDATSASTGTSLTTTRGATSDTGTNIQEAGVDEPDTVKTNGSLLVQLRDDELQVYDPSGSEPAEL